MSQANLKWIKYVIMALLTLIFLVGCNIKFYVASITVIDSPGMKVIKINPRSKTCIAEVEFGKEFQVKRKEYTVLYRMIGSEGIGINVYNRSGKHLKLMSKSDSLQKNDHTYPNAKKGSRYYISLLKSKKSVKMVIFDNGVEIGSEVINILLKTCYAMENVPANVRWSLW